MKPSTRLPFRLLPQTFGCPSHVRPIHSSVAKAANVAPVVGTGPPPAPPAPTERAVNERVERRKRQAELLKTAKVIRNARDGKVTTLKRRFWKDVTIQDVDGALQVHLDSRPLRHPQTKEIIRLPVSKRNLAAALALEWDVLTSAQQATRQHLIPLTGLVCRALDIAEDDASSTTGTGKIRKEIATSLMRYMDTDAVLCWAPPAGQFDRRNDSGESLRDVQKQIAEEIVSFLTTHVWPGIKIEPVLDGHEIFPRKQAEGVREVIQGWVEGLSAWDIAGLERVVLAGKSLVTAARFITEWSEGPVGKRELTDGDKFSIEKAAKAVTLEVDWQAMQWGEVEDTHDVNKEDVRRQLGSVVLLVSGTGKTA